MIAALPGLGVAWLVFRQREPRRGSADMMAAIGAGSIQHADDDEGPALFDRGFRQFVRDMISGLREDMRTIMGRSEEHTSELQSLMRISSAVFCLKKKKVNRKTTTDTPTAT